MATRGDGSYAPGRVTREQILDRAFEHFARVGYRGTSLRDIAAVVGISHPGLRHHFPSKDALLLAVLRQREEATGDWLAARDYRSIPITELMPTIVESNLRQPGLIQLFSILSVEASDPDHPAHDYFRARYARLRAELGDRLRAHGDAGELAPGVDPDAAAVSVIALMDGLQIQWLLDAGAIDMLAEVRRLANALVRTAG